MVWVVRGHSASREERPTVRVQEIQGKIRMQPGKGSGSRSLKRGNKSRGTRKDVRRHEVARERNSILER